MDVGRALIGAGLSVVQPLEDLVTDPTAATALLKLAGWDLSSLAGLGPTELNTAARTVADAVKPVRAVLDDKPDADLDLGAISGALRRLGEAIDAIRSLGDHWSPTDGLPADLPARLVDDLLSHLLVLYLNDHHPVIRAVLDLLGILVYKASAPITTPTGVVVYSGVARPRIDFSRIGRLCTDPGSVLKDRVGVGATRRAAGDVADELFPVVAALLRATGLSAWYGDPGGTEGRLTSDEQQALQRLLRVVWIQSIPSVGNTSALDVAIMLRDDDTFTRAVLVQPTGSVNLDYRGDRWDAIAIVTGTLGGLIIRHDGVHFADGTGAEIHLAVVAEAAVRDSPLVRIGASNGIGLEVARARLAIHLDLTRTGPDAVIEATLRGLRLGVGAPSGDGFLGHAVTADGLSANVDISAAWSPKGGLRFGGSAGLDARIPLHINLGPLTILAAHIRVLSTPDAMTAHATVDLALQLGPFSAEVDGLGLAGPLSVAPGGGNFGAINLAIQIESPRGVGLSVDASVVKGGGFLAHNADKGQYAGGIQLRLEQLSLAAVGLLNTRLPDGSPIRSSDGSPGYSLLVIMSVDFLPPIQLAFGFALTGVGGLLGVNRTVDVEGLRTALPSGSVDSVLLPTDIVENAPRIVADLDKYFPVAEGQYVLGPTVDIVWGEKQLLTARIGVFFEFPRPMRVIVMGRVQLALPNPDAVSIDINLDVVGSLDLDQKQLTLDARLRHSRIASFALTGSGAMRLSWADPPFFLTALGGWHPCYRPPLKILPQERFALTLSSSNNPRLSLRGYCAVTSNTYQVGAELDIYADINLGLLGDFAVAAVLGFDALFNLDPFAFIVDIHASVSLMRNGSPFLGVQLALTVSGFSPCHVVGTATFGLLGKHTWHFDHTFGQRATPQSPVLVDVLAKLREAVAEPSNWHGELPSGSGTLANLKSRGDSSMLIAHPMGRLQLKQRVVPLEMTISLFDGHKLPNAQRFSITDPSLGTKANFRYLQDYFARGQYLPLSDAEKLSQPSFEPMQAGLELSAGSSATPAASLWRTAQVDFDKPQLGFAATLDQTTAHQYAPSEDQLLAQVAGSASAVLGPLSRGKAVYAGTPMGIETTAPSYAVTDRRELSPIKTDRGDAMYIPTYSHAEEQRKAAGGLDGESLQVIETSDVFAQRRAAATQG